MVTVKTFREFKMGQRFLFQPITVSEAHVVGFAGLSGDFNPIHTNKKFAEKTLFKERIAHGMLTASVASGPLGMLLSGTAIALLDASFEFLLPVRLGDTIAREAVVAGLKASRKYGGGVVKFRVVCKNEDLEKVLTGKFTFLVANKPLA